MTGTTMICAYCGRPIDIGTEINGSFYHEECIQGQRHPHPLSRLMLTEHDVRRIVQEELRKVNIVQDGEE